MTGSKFSRESEGVENKLRDDACCSPRAAVLLDVVMKRYRMLKDGKLRTDDD